MTVTTYALDTTWRTLLADLDVHPADVLRLAGQPDDLFTQPSVRLAPEAYYRLFESIEQVLHDPLFPIRICQAIRSESFSPPLFAALCSPNLLIAARRIARYKALIGPMRMEIEEGRERVSVVLVWPDNPALSLVMMELLFSVTLARIGTRRAIAPLEVFTTELPTPLAPYEAFLGSPIRKGASHRVTFSAEDAVRPFLTSNEPLWAAFEPGLRQRLADLETSVTVTERVRAALHEAIPSGQTDIDVIAARLAMSKRTLQRRIEVEGSSFKQILQETRAALARHYLTNTALPASEIAYLLGFDEPNSFYRAFRSWTGRTPDSVRQQV